jgi:hypothetical protein
MLCIKRCNLRRSGVELVNVRTHKEEAAPLTVISNWTGLGPRGIQIGDFPPSSDRNHDTVQTDVRGSCEVGLRHDSGEAAKQWFVEINWV